MKLTDVCIEKPVFAWMLMAATVVFGGVAASRIGISQFPDVDFPTISVSVTWEGAAPEVVENDAVEILEEALIQVEGVRSITSSSRQGGANITVELDLARDVDLALQDVQAKVSQAQRRLPAACPVRLRAIPPEGKAPDGAGCRRDHARRLPGAERPDLGGRLASRREGSDRHGGHRRAAARARRAAGRAARRGRARSERP